MGMRKGPPEGSLCEAPTPPGLPSLVSQASS